MWRISQILEPWSIGRRKESRQVVSSQQGFPHFSRFHLWKTPNRSLRMQQSRADGGPRWGGMKKGLTIQTWKDPPTVGRAWSDHLRARAYFLGATASTAVRPLSWAGKRGCLPAWTRSQHGQRGVDREIHMWSERSKILWPQERRPFSGLCCTESPVHRTSTASVPPLPPAISQLQVHNCSVP